ncbi:MAG TPA: hypothetical protein VF041_18625 [Gemmatimonadaceae bacterium]
MTNAPPPVTTDRTALWLPLLQSLTAASPFWVVWKNVDSAFGGIGDIDAAAPERDWPLIEREFRQWAEERDLGPVIVCHHIPGGLNLIAVPSTMSTLLEVGVKARRIWRGATLFVLDDLKPLMMLDPRGFRRIRPGAEGVFKLLLNGARWTGAPNPAELRRKHVAELLRQDPDGVRMAARLFRPAERAVVRAAERAAEGEWDRGAILVIQTLALARALRTPTVAAKRARFRLRAKATCPVVSTLLRDHRRIPEDRDAWLRRVAVSHPVLHGNA